MTTTSVRPYRELFPTGEMRHNMHYGQIAVMMSKSREILALAGVQSGKTSVGVDWMEREIAERGEGDYLMVSATYPLMQLKLLPEFLDVFQYMEHKGKYRDSDKVFEFAQGKTRVIFGTATNPESLESATAKAAVADEAGQRQFRREAREALLRRLSIHQGRILYPTTPYLLGWLKSELFDRAKEPGSGIEVISWPSTANPAFPQDEFERAKKTMPGWKFRMFYEGKFERPAGLVYDAFDEAACKIKRFAIPAQWPHYTGHDFGCVDDETEILTKTGWKRQDQLETGESTLTFNLSTGQAEWQEIQKVSRWPVQAHPMRLIEQRGHSSLTTLTHRWPVEKRSSGKRVFATTESLKVNDSILAVAQCSNLPTRAMYSDSLVELIAWFWTEGQVHEGGVSLYQNEGEKAEQIRTCLRAEYGEPLTLTRNGRERAPAGWLERSQRQRHSDWGISCHFAINLNGADRILAVTGGAHHKTVSPEFITSLTKEQLILFIETSIKGDGWKRYGRGHKKSGWSIDQVGKERLDVFQMACSLAGIRTYLSSPEEQGQFNHNPRWLLSLYKRNHMQLGKSKQEPVQYDGVIWCPTTPNGTWLARRKGTVYFTGNTANPAAMFYAQDPATGYFYAYDEYKPGPGRSTREHVQEFKRLTEGLNMMKRAGGSHQEEEIREAYRANGWFIQEPKIHDVATGIDRVYALHKLNKLFVFDDLQKYLDEKLAYSYALNDKYEPTDEIEDKNTYHLLDAERYILSDFTPELVMGESQYFTVQKYLHAGTTRRSRRFVRA